MFVPAAVISQRGTLVSLVVGLQERACSQHSTKIFPRQFYSGRQVAATDELRWKPSFRRQFTCNFVQNTAFSVSMQQDLETQQAGKEKASTKEESRDFALQIAGVADDVKGQDIVVIRIRDVSFLADYMVIATAFSKAQISAMIQRLEDNLQRKPYRQEGKETGGWMLVDYGSVILNVMLPKDRERYDLEDLYRQGDLIEFKGTSAPPDEGQRYLDSW
eukprot:CAMPEP_0196651922 /NCGR_PEP_ID=MMETSP1086-20130531/1116_1 /TAXON_ID=77921 /ORGANISM="Cyanoptyche  gloeocystis , Strain SAG4.97" /LENGTH=217 /DNA_ID=CAMNT_0041982223 /DNA_START=26 /DNA_END=676 /DNA_ORIENTATION=-